MSKIKIVSFLVLLTVSGLSSAQQVASPAQQIKEMSIQGAVLQARKANLDLELQIAEKEAEIAEKKHPSSGKSPVGLSASALPVPEEIPTVRGIEGADGRLTATLVTSSGMQAVHKGDKLRGGWEVSSIDVSSVILTKGKEVLRLSFGFDTPTSSTNGTTAQPTAMPRPVPFVK